MTNTQSATAKSEMIIPNKSTIAEDIEVSYGRDARESGSTAGEEPDPDEMEGSLSALTLGSIDEDAGGGSGGDDYYDKMSLVHASVASDRSLKNGRTIGAGREREKMRRDDEFKNATVRSRITGLEN